MELFNSELLCFEAVIVKLDPLCDVLLALKLLVENNLNQAFLQCTFFFTF